MSPKTLVLTVLLSKNTMEKVVNSTVFFMDITSELFFLGELILTIVYLKAGASNNLFVASYKFG